MDQEDKTGSGTCLRSRTGFSFGQAICAVVARALMRDAAGLDADFGLRPVDSRLRAIGQC